MKIKVIASTSQEQIITREQALAFGGKAAGVCYMADSLETIMKEEYENTQKRINRTLNSGHHSVYDHTFFTLYLEGIPKILAMILNNERVYTTSEKSARYTKMETEGREKELYEKWIGIYQKLIQEEYPQMKAFKASTLAKENARYLISVFTPSTNMLYTVSLRQINYILHMCEDYIREQEDNAFTKKVKEVLNKFVVQMRSLYVRELTIKPRTKKLSLFDETPCHNDVFEEVYGVTYDGTMAQLAQAQRHRTISYKMYLDVANKPKYYVPPIIRDTEYEKQWLNDIAELGDNFPQGRLVSIYERGNYEDFILKCQERLCGQAQLEIMEQTYATLKAYVEHNDENYYCPFHDKLKPLLKGTRCNLPYWKCTEPCIWGKNAINRKV